MGELMRYDLDTTLIAGDDSRGQENHPRVLHTAVREARRHHNKVQSFPFVRAEEGLTLEHHGLGIGELVGCGRQDGRLGVDAGAGAKVRKGDVARGHGEEVRWDALLHVEELHGPALAKPKAVIASPHGRSKCGHQ